MKDTYNKPTANIILNGERLDTFFPRSAVLREGVHHTRCDHQENGHMGCPKVSLRAYPPPFPWPRKLQLRGAWPRTVMSLLRSPQCWGWWGLPCPLPCIQSNLEWEATLQAGLAQFFWKDHPGCPTRRPHVAEDGYECSPTQNRKFT